METQSYKIGDLVCERHRTDYMGVVLDVYTKNLGTDHASQTLVVSWIKNPNSLTANETVSSEYVSLLQRGCDV